MKITELAKNPVEKNIFSLLENLIQAAQEIFLTLQNLKGEEELHGEKNKFGEHQLKIDILADKIIQRHLHRSPLVKSFFSEEFPHISETKHQEASLLVGYDPLDGSSLVGNNLSLGSIFGIWQGDNIIGKKGGDLIAAFYFIYGINLNCVIALNSSEVYNLKIKNQTFDNSNFEVELEKINLLKEKSDNFSFGNLRATKFDEKMFKIFLHYQKEQKSLRYSGCMVADIHKIISDQGGIFIYSGIGGKENKLRLIYECAPMSFIIEKLNGKSVNRENIPITNLDITDLNATTSIILGSKQEVDITLDYL